MTVFVDGGFHRGECLSWALNYVIDIKKDWKYFAFEPNESLPKNHIKSNDFVYIDKAISIKNGKAKFKIMRNTMSSGFYDRHNGEIIEIVDVDAVDFSEWVTDNLNREDLNVLKLDIEGEEYKVLNKMIEDESVDFFDEIYV